MKLDINSMQTQDGKRFMTTTDFSSIEFETSTVTSNGTSASRCDELWGIVSLKLFGGTE
jgi:hypothetical protein